ncbi:hypothetical protein [Maritimibacter dapengensis]|uniref:DUF2946 family protein n=1 Tax=Maritimibacter dapengensis TaxID=2836868 RepID=A0ABS6T822_9RHOB|nr:hypothetical protein [Maritimibacter dapengensis]MBV7380791.1 hypothetical protein [Maritimibacter dapengensis]
MRVLLAIAMSLVLALSGAVLAGAKGASHDIGMEIVICSGIGMTTITIGPDGEPIEKSEVCPEGHSLLAATFITPDMPQLEVRLLAVAERVTHDRVAPRHELSPSARGPPVTV